MDSLDLEVLKTCSEWISRGHRCELVTVIKTWGSSPRPEGAMLAICDDGRVVGSVSGGCVEDDLIDRVRKDGITRSLPEIVTYGITADQAHRFGLPCGGTIQLAIEPLSRASGIDELLMRLSEHQLVARRLDLASGEVMLGPASAGMSLQVSESALTTIHGPRWRLLIIGAGQLSRFLAQIAAGMDYHVTVCDPREEYRDGWSLPGIDVRHEMPDDLVIAMRLDSRSAVVALTHDPKLDDLALMEALRSEAFYVGAIGSRLNNAKRRERLKLFDLAEAQIRRLHGPVGLYIGSKTPAEIAISILAEMTAIKNGIRLPAEATVAKAKAAIPASGSSSCDVA
ncbi:MULTISPECIES: XdhC family protein [Oxalobacteraceae]|jgi:xanthine dehydrogenase accessory factor|uniref:XdhC family protein n=1 Tax=Oxalobacteraceae TaxID=75682 RepID=UPI0010A3DCF3|nr:MULTISPECIES: XdhC family protein [Oxalobacteraceae]